MAIVLGVVDANPERRHQFVDSAIAYCKSQSGLDIHQWAHGDLVLVAATASVTPISQASGPGTWTWVVGDIYTQETQVTSASYLESLIEKTGPLAAHGQGGYYLACTVSVSGQVTLGTDVLGLFPVYVWSDAEVMIFSTVPGLLHRHPRCVKRISPEGLAGILLQSYIANCQTIWDGIRRPDPGHAVQWRPGYSAENRLANPLVPTEAHFGLKYGPARKFFDEVLHNAVVKTARHLSSPHIMLSGGLDSRLLAGHLHKIHPDTAKAVIFGNPDDNEVRCASRVAKTLGMGTVRIPVRFAAYEQLALAEIQQEHLSNTFHDFAWLTGRDALKTHTGTIINGFLGDPIMGGSLIPQAYNHKRGTYEFDSLMGHANRWGFSPEEIAQLITAFPMERAVQECIEKMRATFEALPGLPYQKVMLWGLYGRCRYHVGPYAWRLAAAVWPVMPYIDRDMLEVSMGMPLDFLSNRNIQVDALKYSYRHLAELPLDRNSHDLRPLIQTRRYAVQRTFFNMLSRLTASHDERRTYYRVFDINNSGWTAIRQLAEQHRPSASRLLNPTALAEYIPAPERKIACADGITDSARLKTLIGLMLLSHDIE